VFIDIELPGVPPSALTVESQPDRIVVRGEKPSLANLVDRETLAASREFGPFTSEFALPADHVLTSLEQRLEHGVLHLKAGIALRQALPAQS
jgi:HSP20 family molecular chaperone IbpA